MWPDDSSLFNNGSTIVSSGAFNRPLLVFNKTEMQVKLLANFLIKIRYCWIVHFAIFFGKRRVKRDPSGPLQMFIWSSISDCQAARYIRTDRPTAERCYKKPVVWCPTVHS